LSTIQIAIDGHSSTGKSTLARALASHLGILYLDSGAMYRAVALYANENKLSDAELIAQLDRVKVDFDSKNEIRLNGRVVESEIRSMEVSSRVSGIAKLPAVRKKLVELQQMVAQSVVMDGRDIGTVVFPQAILKLFMTAKPEVRAKRRFEELVQQGKQVSYQEVLENLRSRDFEDENRETDPLKMATDAILLDNTEMTLEQQLREAIALFEAKS
jgi:CMP/dCMP kinase